MDIMMPGKDGYADDARDAQAIRGSKVPIIAFTAKVDEGERQRCIDAGASAYVPSRSTRQSSCACSASGFPRRDAEPQLPDAAA